MKLTEEQLAAFQRDGFLVVDGVFDAAELERYGRAVDRAVARRTADDP